MTNRWIQICNLGPDAAVGDWSAVDPSVFLSVCVCVDKPRGEVGAGASLPYEGKSADCQRLRICSTGDPGAAVIVLTPLFPLSLSLSPASALTLWIWIDPLKALRHTDSNAQTELEAWKASSEVWGLVSRWACSLQPAWILDSYGIDTSCGAWRREPTASATYCGTDSLSGALRAAWSIPEPTIFKWAKLIQGSTLNTEPLQNRTHFLFFSLSSSWGT